MIESLTASGSPSSSIESTPPASPTRSTRRRRGGGTTSVARSSEASPFVEIGVPDSATSESVISASRGCSNGTNAISARPGSSTPVAGSTFAAAIKTGSGRTACTTPSTAIAGRTATGSAPALKRLAKTAIAPGRFAGRSAAAISKPTLPVAAPIGSKRSVSPARSTVVARSASRPSEKRSIESDSGPSCGASGSVVVANARARSSAGRRSLPPSLGSIARIASIACRAFAEKGERTSARSSKAITITSPSPPPSHPPPKTSSIRAAAASFARSRRVAPPGSSIACIEPERSTRITVRPPRDPPSASGCATAAASASRTSSCSRSSRFGRSRCHGAFASRSSTERRHSSVEEISRRLRRRRRK